MSEKFSKPKILPPLWMLMSVIAQFALDRWLPVAEWIGSPHNWLGGALALPGFAAILWAAGSFRIGMVFILLGFAVIFGSVTALIPVLVFAWIIDRKYIRNEEIFLREIHGEAFDQYKTRVRRWL
jgi:protein-S-isoprenylcysteine O-methyltransferase Ste14